MAETTQDSKNLTLGAGEVRFARFQPGTYNHLGYRLLGNCPQFNLSKNSQTLEHRNSMGGLRRLDKSINLDLSYKGAIKTDDFSFQNLSLWMGAYIDGTTITASTGATYTIASPRTGFWYQIGQSAANFHGDRRISSVVVAHLSTTYVEGVDYQLDTANGLIYIIGSGAISSSTSITITYNIGGSTRRSLVATSDTIEGELLFIARNPVGPSYNCRIPRCSITPTGDLSLITDGQFVEMGFDISTLQRDDMQHYYLETRSAANP